MTTRATSTARHGKRRGLKRPGRSRGRRMTVIAALVALTLGAATVALSLSRGSADAGFGILKGRWVRLDGGYVLEMRAIDSAGMIDAAYLNPWPITVARAEA